MSFIVLWQLLGCAEPLSESRESRESGENGEQETRETVWSDSGDLVMPESWVIDPSADPFPEHLTAKHTCDPAGMAVEEGLLEIYTADCGYLVARQPSLEEVLQGDSIEVLVYHSSLTAQDPAEAHAALTIDGELIWEETVPIPSISQVYAAEVMADFEADAGSDVVLHLHNHGSNVWTMGHLRVRKRVEITAR